MNLINHQNIIIYLLIQNILRYFIDPAIFHKQLKSTSFFILSKKITFFIVISMPAKQFNEVVSS